MKTREKEVLGTCQPASIFPASAALKVSVRFLRARWTGTEVESEVGRGSKGPEGGQEGVAVMGRGKMMWKQIVASVALREVDRIASL